MDDTNSYNYGSNMDKKMIKPLNDRVIIKRTIAEEKSKGGIILTETEKQTTGIVIATASDEIGVGDTVMFGTYAGSELKLNGEQVLIMKFEELVAKIC